MAARGEHQHWRYNEKMVKKDKVFSPLYGVELKEGLFKTTFDNNREFLKQFKMNDLLYWFDEKMGNETDGKPYRGWFEDGLKGQSASQYLMGAGNALRWVEDEQLRQGVETILDKIEACEEEDHFMMPISQYEFTDYEYPHYTRIWLNYGLIAAGLGGSSRAWDMLRRWQDWFNHCKDLPIIKYTSLAFQGIVGSTYVYQTPVGVEEDYQVARQYYEEDWRLAQFMLKERNAPHIRFQPGVEPHPHGTEIEAFEGYLDLYRATGAPYYLKAVLGARDLYKEDWQHPGGGIVLCEHTTAEPGCGWIAKRYPYNELCCAAFWVNFNHRLHRLFPDTEDYVNEIERSIYNIAIANQDGGQKIRYFAHLEGTKDKGGLVTCCCGVGTRLFGKLPEYLYSIAEDRLYVDIYAASSIRWAREAGDVTVETVTDMPESGRVTVKLSMADSAKFLLALRMPGWMAGKCEVRLNGEVIATGEPGSYLKLDREWHDGDALDFELPMAFRTKKYTGKDQIVRMDRYSYEYGPLLFAVTGPHTNNESVWIRHDPEAFESWILPTDKPLTFAIAGDNEHLLEPYYRLDDETPMTCFPVFATPGGGYR